MRRDCILSLCIDIVVCIFSSVEEKRDECFIIIVFLLLCMCIVVCDQMALPRGNMG